LLSTGAGLQVARGRFGIRHLCQWDRKLNLLNVRCVRGLFGSRWFPIVPQFIMLLVFGLLIARVLGYPQITQTLPSNCGTQTWRT